MQTARYPGVRSLITALSVLCAAAAAALPPAGDLVPFQGSVYFAESGPAELWQSDGTPQGTVRLRTFDTPGSTPPSLFAAAGTRLYFFVGRSLWFVEGSAVTHVADVPRAPSASAAIGGEIDFVLPGGGTGNVDLWSSDGTPGGTQRVRTLATGVDAEAPSTLTPMGGRLYFWVTVRRDATLWQTDGTFGGTTPNIDFGPISTSSGPTPVAFGDRLALISFGNAFADHPFDLFSTDGTEAGLVPLLAFVGTPPPGCTTGCPLTGPTDLTDVDGELFFIADDGVQGRELWSTDGTPAGTGLVKDALPGPASGLDGGLLAIGNSVYFPAASPGHGTELWVSRGTAVTTSMVLDIVPGPGSSHAYPQSALGDRLLFTTVDDASGALSLWVTNETLVGTQSIRDFPAGAVLSGFAPIPGQVMFFETAPDGSSILWTTDGSRAGTASVASFPASGGARSVQPVPHPHPGTRTVERP
jgi:ELWxxDGT repeat protein